MPGDLSHIYWDGQLRHVARSIPARKLSDVGDEVVRLREEVANLKRALKTREVIGMAKGVLMARECCHPDEAFDMLRRASQRENRKLAEVAEQIVKQNTAQAGGSAGDISETPPLRDDEEH